MIRQTQTIQHVRTTPSSASASASAAAAPTFSEALASAAASAAAAAPAPAAAPAGGGFGNPADTEAYRLEQNVAFRATRESLDQYFRDNPQGLDVEAGGREEIVHRLPEMIDQVAPETQQENYRKVAKLISGILFSRLYETHYVSRGEDTE